MRILKFFYELKMNLKNAIKKVKILQYINCIELHYLLHYLKIKYFNYTLITCLVINYNYLYLIVNFQSGINQ